MEQAITSTSIVICDLLEKKNKQNMFKIKPPTVWLAVSFNLTSLKITTLFFLIQMLWGKLNNTLLMDRVGDIMD